VEQLAIMSTPAVSFVSFGIFNLAWPSIIFWILVIIAFVLAIRARIPQFMESDAASRKGEAGQ